MKVYLVDSKKINKYNLPAKVEEFFLIPYKAPGNLNESTISLEAIEGKWSLRSNGSINVMNGNNIVDSVIIEEYGFYYLKVSGQNIFLILFAMPSVESQLYRLDPRNLKSISIGSNQKCNISHMNMITSNLQAEIKLTEAGWQIVSGTKLKVGTYLNDFLVRSAKLYTGDIIFINGLKIIWMGDFFLINNPNNSVIVNGIPAYEMDGLIDNTNYDPVSEDEQNAPQYKESDYFYHIPRIRESSVEVDIQIDSPPAMQNIDNSSFLLNIGSSLTMLASVFTSGYSVFIAAKGGVKSMWDLLPQFITFGSMFLGSLLLPRVVEKYQKRRIKKLNAVNERKYLEYLKTKEIKINQELQKASAILKENNYDAQKCCELIMSHGRNMWSRELRDNDFLTVRLGIGTIPSNLVISAPTEQFSVDENNLLEKVFELRELAKNLTGVPIVFSLF